MRTDWGEAIGNYGEFRFFTGLRPSEQITLLVTDYDARRGVLSVTKGSEVAIATRQAVLGDDLDHLEHVVLAEFREAIEAERVARTNWLRSCRGH